MLAIHDQFTRQMCDRLTTTCMGLGLVRLLQDAKRFEEARATLYLLGGAESVEPKRNTGPSRTSSSAAKAATWSIFHPIV